jgi:hypothetical protein
MTAIFIAASNPACAKEPAAKNTDSKTVSNHAGTSAAPKTNAQPAVSSSAVNPPAQQTNVQSESAQAAQDKISDTKIDVYLFHGSYRCYSCNLMEEMAVEAIDEQLAKEKEAGIVVFHHVNIEESPNRHFIDDYKIASISIIISQKSGGKEKYWKNLDKVWMLLKNRENFKEYVIKEIQTYLKG